MPRHVHRMFGAGLGGATGTVADVAVLIALVETGVAVGVAAFAGAVAGAGLNFVVNKRWAFRDRSPASVRQIGSFAAVAAVTAVLMALAMHAAVDGAGAPYLPAKALSAAVVFAAWSYPAQRHLVFAPRRSPSAAWETSRSLSAGTSRSLSLGAARSLSLGAARSLSPAAARSLSPAAARSLA